MNDFGNPQTAAVFASYARCRERGGFIEAFYRQLWARDPDIRGRFRTADMYRQHEVMRESINTLLMFARGSEIARLALTRLGKLHGVHGHRVTSSMYVLFINILVDTAREWDPKWSGELAPAWRAALEPGIDYMASLRGD